MSIGPGTSRRIAEHYEARQAHLKPWFRLRRPSRRQVRVGLSLLGILAALALMQFAGVGCSVRMDTHIRGSLFRHDAQEAAMSAADQVAQARAWFAAGLGRAEVVALLQARGIDGTEAERIAALAAGK